MSAENVRAAWANVSDELTGLGLKIKLHLEQEMAEEDTDEVRTAFERLGEAIDDVIDAAENVVSDPAVREDVVTTGKKFAQALSTTFHETKSVFKDRVL